jgi:hypothetical protein
MGKFVFTLTLLLFSLLLLDAQNCNLGNPVAGGESCTFNSSGTLTFTVPSGNIANITVQAWGGGGAGGSGANKEGGGGGGAYASSTFDVSSGTYSINVTVGAGGNTLGTSGAASTVTISGNTVTAAGGSSGSGDNGFAGGKVSASVGQTRNAGGNGGDAAPSGGQNRAGGGGGGSATSSTAGVDGFDGVSSTGGLGGTGQGSGGKGGDDGAAGANGSAPGGGGGGKGRNGATTSGFGANGRVIVKVNSVVLPVEFLYFNIEPRYNTAELQWATASEQNNERFIIERSADGRTYHEIDELAGAGTTTERQEYQYTDRSPLKGINYYRLKQVDYDGQYEYSLVRSVTINKGKDVLIYPTITHNYLQIEFIQEELEVTFINVFNLQGALVLQESFASFNNSISVDLSRLIPGSYILEMKTGREVIRSRVFRM